jgi:hypothetical protein
LDGQLFSLLCKTTRQGRGSALAWLIFRIERILDFILFLLWRVEHLTSLRLETGH